MPSTIQYRASISLAINSPCSIQHDETFKIVPKVATIFSTKPERILINPFNAQTTETKWERKIQSHFITESSAHSAQRATRIQHMRNIGTKNLVETIHTYSINNNKNGIQLDNFNILSTISRQLDREECAMLLQRYPNFVAPAC